MDAAWLPDPTGAHEVRWWDGSAWTAHVSDGPVQGLDPLQVPLPPPVSAAPAVPPPPPTGAGTGSPEAGAAKGSWKDRLKTAAQQAGQQGRQFADQAKVKVAEQQAGRLEQWANDPDTLWHGQSRNAATKATGLAKAFYRITRDRVWIDSGLLGVRSEYVPLWAIKDLDVRQNLLQRGKDEGDVVLHLEDPLYGVNPTGAFDVMGQSEPGGGHTSGQVVLDNIEGPYRVRELLLPLVGEARRRKLVERQSQYVHVNPAYGAVPGVAGAPAPPPTPAPAPSAAPVPDLADQLRKLADLRDQGILTDDEFAVQKARLLGA